jgi:hypothetical protein
MLASVVSIAAIALGVRILGIHPFHFYYKKTTFSVGDYRTVVMLLICMLD